MDDLADQPERMLRGDAEPDERDVGVLPRRDRADLRHLDLACDHVVAEPAHDPCQQLQPVGTLVRNENAQPVSPVLGHQPAVGFADICLTAQMVGPRRVVCQGRASRGRLGERRCRFGYCSHVTGPSGHLGARLPQPAVGESR